MDKPVKNAKVSKKAMGIVAGILIVLGVSGYFLFYQPHEANLTYQKNVECSNLVASTEANNEATYIRVVGNARGVIFGQPQSHFSKKLNTCLGYFTMNQSFTLSGAVDMYISSTISDVVSNKAIITSVTEMTPTNGTTPILSSGLPTSEFKAQETALMSE